MASWTIGKRITTIAVTLIVLTLGMAVSVYWSLSGIRGDVNSMSTDVVPGLIWAGAAKSASAERLNAAALAVTAPTREQAAPYITQSQDLGAKVEGILNSYEKTIFFPEDRKNFEAVMAARKTFGDQLDACLALVADGKKVEASAALHDKVMPAFLPYFNATDVVVQYNHASGDKLVADSNASIRSTTEIVFVAAALSAILGAVFSFVVIRGLNRILQGLTSQLGAGADQTASASAQLSSSGQTLAAGASEQAASLEETSASLEEIASMTKRNAESATHAKQLSDETRLAAEGGSTNMAEMKQAMDGIKAASANIAKIVRTIDEIAFQTNILALNAAVEAARAGEAGAGFAVVAEEVRSLAQRSANSAKETAEKIEDSVTRSEHGVQISAKVAQSLEEILVKARKVDGLVAEIATASNEQSQGIGQVTIAVSQMDKVTQGNAAGAEETASASEELSAQAEVMRESVRSLQGLVGGKAAGRSPAIVSPVKPVKRAMSPKLAPAPRRMQPLLRPVPPRETNGTSPANGEAARVNGDSAQANGAADHDQFFK